MDEGMEARGDGDTDPWAMCGLQSSTQMAQTQRGLTRHVEEERRPPDWV